MEPGITRRPRVLGGTTTPGSPSFAVPTLLLDAIAPTTTLAFSTRQLRAAYGGSCLRIRRSSDNTEQDIGFNASDVLDTAALASFVGANDGFVTKWYDQSGNGFDFDQTVAVNQPRLVLAGTVHTLNGNPAVRFDASVPFFLHRSGSLSSILTGGQTAYTTFATVNMVTIPSSSLTFNANMIWGDGGFANWEPLGGGGNPTYKMLAQVVSGAANKNPLLPMSLNTTYLGMSNLGGGNLSLYQNGGSPNQVACGAVDSSAATDLFFGCAYNSTFSHDGYIMEFITFPVQLSSADSNKIANGSPIIGGGNMATYAGITWTNI
jgi:hypothetical protein